MFPFTLILIFIALAEVPASTTTATPSDVIFYLFNQANPTDSIYSFDLTNTSGVGQYVNCSKDSLFVIHGWDERQNYHNFSITVAVLDRYDINVFGVDYPYYSNYSESVAEVPQIGQAVGEFINSLVNNVCADESYSYDRIRLVGHSLGAHLAGVAGKNTKGQVASIVGLDPAGPFFSPEISKNRLTSADAQHVQVIHTNMGALGTPIQSGHADFYPNGGKAQPNCNVLSNCAHMRAIDLYVESIRNLDSLVGTQCSSFSEYADSMCDDQPLAIMGGVYPVPASGAYYLTTA